MYDIVLLLLLFLVVNGFGCSLFVVNAALPTYPGNYPSQLNT